MCACVCLSQLDLPVCTADSHQCYFNNKKLYFLMIFWVFLLAKFSCFFPTLNLSNVLIYRNNSPNFWYQFFFKKKIIIN